jgi:hypothetical protein
MIMVINEEENTHLFFAHISGSVLHFLASIALVAS